tara:strand:+ start:96 stop:1346 length:1251 start_codon:yes stop_codon:yes gene_type:complete
MNKRKKILFVHQNFPAQYKHIYRALIEEGHEVHSLSIRKYNDSIMKNHHYNLSGSSTEGINEWTVEFESKMIRAESAAKKALEIKENGFYPDLIIGHPGWGETFFLKEIWPETKLLSYVEFYYKTKDCDVDFDKDFVESVLKRDFDSFYNYTRLKLTARNAPFLASYSTSDFLVCPTEYQKSLVPSPIREGIEVIHDGIDTDTLKPNDEVTITINKRKFNKDDEIVTYISRSLDPYRGFHIFMRSLPEVMGNNPNANIFIVGGKETHGYGAPLKEGNFKDFFLDEIKDKIDMSRIFFLDFLEYSSYIRVLQISTVHIYLTYPFVLSWSMLEAMSCEALIIGSKTDPVTEVITDNKTGLLIDFFDISGLSKKITKVLKNKDNFIKIRKNARKKIIQDYDLKNTCLPAHLALINKALK